VTPTNDTPRASGRGGRRAGAGRPRQPTVQYNGEPAVVLRDGDEVTLIEGNGPTILTVRIVDGAAQLVRDDGKYLTLIPG